MNRFNGLSLVLASALTATIVPLPAQAAPVADVAIESPAPTTNRILIRFRPNVSPDRVESLISSAGGRAVGHIDPIGVHIMELPEAASDEAVAHAFGQKPDVEFAEVDRLYKQDTVANDPYFTSAWHLPNIQATEAWNATTGSSSVIVAIIDSGVDASHPDLSGKLLPGWNFYDNNSNTADVNGHGTAVAGTATATGNNAVGVTGISWTSRILPIRVSDAEGYAYTSALANGITYAADHGARVANISFSASLSSSVASAAQYMQSKGGVVTISAGNDGTFVTNADNPYALTVSATNQYDSLASWSTRGNNVDLGAPGERVLTTSMGGQYGYWSGTSFSAPVVAGVAALVIAANPDVTGSQLQQILKDSADDLGTGGWDTQYGWGRVNAFKAVNLAFSMRTTADTTAPSVSITSPSGGATVSGAVTVNATASDNVGVASVSLIVDGKPHSSDSVAPYSFTWDSAGALNGTHVLKVEAKDAAGNVSSSQVSVTVSNTITVVTDTTAPSVTITSPYNGGSVSKNVSVRVNATDNVAVTRVELYVDGRLTSSSSSSPFTTSWNAQKAQRGAHTLQTRAYDAASNIGSSPMLTVYK